MRQCVCCAVLFTILPLALCYFRINKINLSLLQIVLPIIECCYVFLFVVFDFPCFLYLFVFLSDFTLLLSLCLCFLLSLSLSLVQYGTVNSISTKRIKNSQERKHEPTITKTII